jgi:hypothetical protein
MDVATDLISKGLQQLGLKETTATIMANVITIGGSIAIAHKLPSLNPFNNLTKTANINDSKIVSPNVQKILNSLDDIKTQGGAIKINPLKSNQEINMTIQKGVQKLDLRIETHPIPKKFGGNGDPQRHLNLDLYPNKKVLPNNGHKILE